MNIPSALRTAVYICSLLNVFALSSQASDGQDATHEAPVWHGGSEFKVSLPPSGRLIDGAPEGKGWSNLIASLDDWNLDEQFWKLTNDILSGDYEGGEQHQYAWTKKSYKDFELNVVFRLRGTDANSGICFRLHPTNHDDAPGYQADMGSGYWGALWEERRAGMVQAFPPDSAEKLVFANEWNHYYIVAKGHHIQAWLNGVKTIDIDHTTGLEDGAVGLQLCHGDKHTQIDVRSMFLREL